LQSVSDEPRHEGLDWKPLYLASIIFNPPFVPSEGGHLVATFTGILRKTIDLNEAPACGLEAQLGLPPDVGHVLAYAKTELEARWEALDELFHLNSDDPDIWEQRAKSLIERIYGLGKAETNWWGRLACRLAEGHVPGLSIRKPNKRKHGSPRQWTDERLVQLFADVEFLKKTTRLNVQAICKRLPQGDYADRYGDHGSGALSRQYSLAKKASGYLLLMAAVGDAARNPIEAMIELHALKAPLRSTLQNLRK
jgi:hypothetical protein